MGHVIADPPLRAAFLGRVKEMRTWIQSAEFERWLEGLDGKYLATLHTEFPWLPAYPVEELRARAQHLENLRGMSFGLFYTPPPPRPMPHSAKVDPPQPVHGYVIRRPEGDQIELHNAISRPLLVTRLWMETPPEKPGAAPERREQAIHRPLPPTPWPTAPEVARIALPWPLPEGGGWRIGGEARLGRRTLPFSAIATSPLLDAAPLPTPTLAALLAAHPYLSLEERSATRGRRRAAWVRVAPGTHRVGEDLVIPEGVGLRIGPGTSLRFSEAAMLRVRGPMELVGSASAPIRLLADGASWPGLVHLGMPGRRDTPVRLEHVEIRNTRGATRPGWGLTGGVTIRAAAARLASVVFAGSQGEDALNLVRSRFELTAVEFRDSASDALDVDFGVGSIRGGRILRAGGDGIDTSGSEVEIQGTDFDSIRDKALSIGEASRAEIRGVTIRHAGVGLASKDGSEARIADSELQHIGLAALMAYVKKPQYGEARLEASGLRILDSARTAIAELGSAIVIEGVPIPGEAVDVEELYRSGPMRKAGS